MTHVEVKRGTRTVLSGGRVQCNLKMDRALHRKLKTISIERGVTMQALLEQAVRQHLEALR